jgi:hypothetical protein
VPISDFLDFMPDSVSFNAWLSQDRTGKPTYDELNTTVVRCRISMENHLIVNAEGREVLARGTITLGTTVAPNVKDRITLPAGNVPTSPPMLAVNLSSDENGPHHVVIKIG